MNPITMLPYLSQMDLVPQVPAAEPDVATSPLMWLGTFVAMVAPAAAMGAISGSYLATVTPKQKHYARIGAVGGVVALSVAMMVLVSREQAARNA